MAEATLTITDIQILYTFAKKVFKKEMSITDALKAATIEIPHRAPKSINNYLYNFADMMRGKKLSRTMPIDAHIYFLENIANDFGQNYLFYALKAVQLHIIYIYKIEVIDKNKNPQSLRNTTLRKQCEEIAKANNIDIDFSENIFLPTNIEKYIDEISNKDTSCETEEIGNKSMKTTHPKNLILFGPPGTGKTYNTINYAIAILENKDIEEISELDRQELLESYNEYKANGQIEFCTFHQSYGYEEFIEGIKPDIVKQPDNKETGNIIYRVKDGIFKNFCIKKQTEKNKVFIIDEINRGNISKIFGELITLIEDTKRIGEEEETLTRLPYSGELFGIPNNIYIIGTMNTADRSIALIDTALRRRFEFIEMQPKPYLLENVLVEGISIQAMLDKINRRIEVLYDKDHTIGHSFFMKLLKEENRNINVLEKIFRLNILPLLKEYFYDDYEKIALVLNDDLRKNNAETNFIIKQADNYADIINTNTTTILPAYTINEKALSNPEAYIKIYNR